MRIIGPPSGDRVTVEAGVGREPNVHPRFLAEILPALWRAATAATIDPVVAVAQAANETGWGRFEGNAQPWFYNTCGLKVRHKEQLKALLGITDDDAHVLHQQFPNWDIGARAHIQHLRIYAGWPVIGDIVDPRYTIVADKHLRLETVEELGGNWAPAADYGSRLVDLARRILG